LLVGTGTLLPSSTQTVSITNNYPTQSFALASTFTPEPYALGPDGLFDETGPFAFDLLINSGLTDTSFVPVCEPPLIYFSGVTTPQGDCIKGGDNINWEIIAPPGNLPEPSSLVLFGSALLGAGGLVRRRRRTTHALLAQA
jgi:hypothetical protein